MRIYCCGNSRAVFLVVKIIFGQRLGQRDCIYLRRWCFITKWGSVRLHKWTYSDDLRHPHDHAWDFWSIVLKGQISDLSDGELTLRKRWSINKYSAEHRHSVVVDKPAWTLLLTGPERRPKWGFWVNGKFRKRNKYFFEYGHHNPCE